MKPLSLVVLLLAAGLVRADVLTIKNDSLELRYDSASKRFALVSRQQTVLSDGSLDQGAGEAKVISINHPIFGKGQAIEAGSAKLMVFPSLPFVLIRSTLRNPTADIQDLNRVPIATATVNLQGDLMTMGTGGLQTPEKNTGSYAWLAIAEPAARHGIVAGWITDDRGSGVVFSSTRLC